jgi:hypothetical protein
MFATPQFPDQHIVTRQRFTMANTRNAMGSAMRTIRARNGIVFDPGEFALTVLSAPRPMIVAKEEPRDDHHPYRL